MFELAVQVFWARVRGTLKNPGAVFGFPASELDLNDDLGLDKHKVLLEYSAWCQFRPQWAFYYSIMPIHLDGDHILTRNAVFGTMLLPIGTRLVTKWDFTYQRVGIVYQPINTCNATVSVYGSWLFNEQRYRVGSDICGGTCATVDRTRNMVMTGLGLQKCIRTMCNGGTLSCDTKASVGFLDNTFALDVQTGLQFSVPMNAGRWGFVRGGYRLLNFTEDRNDLRMDTSMEGGFVETGLIF
jgi:hypothetical protein